MNRIRTVVIDDVALARERVRLHLADEVDVEIVGEAANGADAVRLIAREVPDLAFLDVALPDFDGFDVARRIPSDRRPVVVYLTAHDDKAIQAFDVSALDYLLKPFDRERFHQALNRARTQIALRGGKSGAEPKSYLERLAIKDGRRANVIAMRDIDFVDVAGHYLCVHVGKDVHLIRGSLSDFESRLDPNLFARVHRSAIVRLDRIKSLAARRNGDSDINLHDGQKLLLSRNYRETVKQRLGLAEM